MSLEIFIRCVFTSEGDCDGEMAVSETEKEAGTSCY